MAVPRPGWEVRKFAGRMIVRLASRYGQSSRCRYVWLPSVMTSAPALNSSSACFELMPMPPEAFSPFTTTKSAANSLRRSSSIARRTRRPAEPTTSPTKRIVVKAQTLEHRPRPAHTWGMAERHEQTGAGGVQPPPRDGEPADPPARRPGATPVTVEPVVVPRWVQAVILPLAIIGGYLVIKAAWRV